MPSGSPTRPQIVALLASELTHDPQQVDRRLRLVDEALELAKRAEDDRLLNWVEIVTTYPQLIADRRPASPTALLERSSDPTAGGDPALRCMSRMVGAAARLTVGDVDNTLGWLSA